MMRISRNDAKTQNYTLVPTVLRGNAPATAIFIVTADNVRQTTQVPTRSVRTRKIPFLNLQFAIIFLFFSSLASAHEIHVFATVEGKTIQGKAYYHDDAPVREGTVKALDSLGEILAEGKADAEGKFSLPVRFRCDYRVLVDAGDGHGGETFVEAEDLPADLPAREGLPPEEHDHAAHTHPAIHAGKSPASSDALAGLGKKVDQLRESLECLESKRRLSDILGGIGYIFGLAGLGMYFLSLRNRKGLRDKG
jgi:nickel transport protein